jgi:hypothetical protein
LWSCCLLQKIILFSIGPREVSDTRFRNTAINFSNLHEQRCYFLSIHEIDLDLKIQNKSRLWRYRILLISVFSIWVNTGIWRCKERQKLDWEQAIIMVVVAIFSFEWHPHDQRNCFSPYCSDLSLWCLVQIIAWVNFR